MGIWKLYGVKLQVTNRMMAGIPKNPDLIEAWLVARQPTEAAIARRRDNGEEVTPIATLIEEVAEQVDNDDGAEERAWLGFKKDDEGLYIEGSNVKAHLKDCANVLQKILDFKALRSKLADRVYVVEEIVRLGVAEPSGYYEHPVHVMTRQGPRSALKRNDYVERPLLAFTLRVLADGVIKEDLLRDIFEYGGTHGIGAERGLGYGRYELVELSELE